MPSSSMPWVKVYGDLLGDRKMRALARSTCFTFVEMVVLAGECDADGALIDSNGPIDSSYIAWRLNMPMEELAQDLEALRQAGLIDVEDGAWTVLKFEERQGRKHSDRREQWRLSQQKRRAMEKTDSTECQQSVNVDNVLTQQSVNEPEGEEEKEKSKSKRENKSSGASAPPLEIPQIAIPETKPAEVVIPPETVTLEVKSPPEVKPARPRDLLFDAIAEVTASDVKLLGSRIGKVTAEFRAINATPEQVRKVAAWFKANDWRGGEKLTFGLLKEVWQQGLKGAPIIANGKTSRRQQIADRTEPERAESIRKAGERNAARSVGANDRLLAQLIQARADRDRAQKRQDTSAANYFDQQIASLESKLVAERVTA